MLDIETINKKYLDLISSAESSEKLDNIRLDAIGKKGEVTLLMRSLGNMDHQERLHVSPLLNNLKKNIEEALIARKESLKEEEIKLSMNNEWLDLSQDSREINKGSIHPVSRVTEEIISIFADLGFSVAEGPQIESDWYNFDALNIPPDHPARQEFDTFYVDSGKQTKEGNVPNVLRTHTSPVQIRFMEENGVPCKIIAPGRAFRSDYDLSHTPMFHQVEGLAIGEKISMANLKWVLVEFCKAFFEIEDLDLRFRASHFPFTEPSAEVDIRCSWSDNKLAIGKGEDWLEILGSGMVHPKVLEAAGVDSEKYQGFAFGMGIDRLAMLKYGIPDLRSFFENDLRWLKHYSFSPESSPNLYDNLSG
ncbi:phenylalanine--tRNA ligase subunit alpha [bacterium TMED277]|nr:MAG: phenylalanine--tRNA ligase subunit alpha [bacterium TMED277]